MAKNWEWFGYFFPPGAPKEGARPGRLSYTPEDGLTLRLIGAFEERVLPAIHGVVERVPVTLVDCIATSTPMKGFDAVAVSQIIDVQSALFGIMLSDPDSPSFEALDIELEQLSEWSAEQDMTLLFDVPDGADSADNIDLPPANADLPPAAPDDDVPTVAGPSRRGWGVRVDPAESRSARVNDELQIKLGRRYVLPNFDNYRDRIEVETRGTSVLTAESGQPRNLGEWIDIAHACQDLLSLASYSPCAVLRLTLTTEKGVQESDNTARKVVHLFIDNVVKGEPDAEGMTPWRMLFNLADVDFSVLMPRWFEVRDLLGPTCNMVLGLKYIPGGYLETQLLTAVGAAEGWQALLSKSYNDHFRFHGKCFPVCGNNSSSKHPSSTNGGSVTSFRTRPRLATGSWLWLPYPTNKSSTRSSRTQKHGHEEPPKRVTT